MQPSNNRRASQGRAGLTAACTAAVLLSVSAAAWAQPAAPAAGDRAAAPAMTPEQIAAAQAMVAAQAEDYFNYAQSKLLVDMARTLAGPPPAPGRAAKDEPTWRLDRQAVLLEAATRVRGVNPEAFLELYLVRGRSEAACRLAARQDSLAAAKFQAAGKTREAQTLNERAASQTRLADAIRLRAVEDLAHCVAQEPSDVGAWQWLIEERLALTDAIDQRVALLQAELDRLRSPPASQPDESPGAAEQAALDQAVSNQKQSSVLALLAEQQARRAGPEAAKGLLAEAVRLWPLNYRAKAAIVSLAGEKATPADQLGLLLTSFRLSPANIATAGAISELLARCGLYTLPLPGAEASSPGADRGAAGFCAYEEDVRHDLAASQPMPAELLIRHGQVLALAGDTPAGAKLIRQAIAQTETGTLGAGRGDALAPPPPINLPARVLLAELLAARSRADASDRQAAADAGAEAQAVLDYYQAHKDKPAVKDNGPVLATFAWFHLRVSGDVKQAHALASSGFKRAPDSPWVRLVLGAASAQRGKDGAPEAIKLLSPLAESADPWAMYYLGVAESAAGKADEAAKALTRLASAWPGDPAGLAAAARLKDMGRPVPATDLAPLRDLLLSLPDGLFGFYQSPGRYVHVQARLISGTRPGYPVTLQVAVVNRSNQPPEAPPAEEGAPPPPPPAAPEGFPVSIGPGMMLWPDLLISAAVQLPGEGSPRIFRDYCRLRIPAPGLLGPGEAVTTEQTVDVGPLGQLLALTPQAASTVSLELLVNPDEAVGGGWTSGPGGYSLSLQFPRTGFRASHEDLSDLFGTLKEGSAAQRLMAERLLGSLLAEQQLTRGGRLSYAVRDLPDYRLSDKLVEAAGLGDPRVRAFWCDAVYPAGLAGDLRTAAVNALADKDWLVRLLAVRLAGDRLGASAAERLKAMARGDAEPLVRQMAKTYLEQWAASPKR